MQQIDLSSPLRDSRHEMFAQRLSSGLPQAQAYREAGFAPRGANANASRMIADDSNGIRQRVEWLKAQSATRTVMSSSEKREICAEIARDPEQPASARIRAVVADADLEGVGAAANANTELAQLLARLRK